MAASLRHITRPVSPGQSLGLLLPDVPGISAGDILTILDTFRAEGETRPTRAGAKGSDIPGTPLFLPHDLARSLGTLTGDDGGRALLKGKTRLLRFPDDRAIRDLDTPEDWAAWRAETNTPD
jgi:CTP:molybdopterin cytidylyltransferase MocA